MQCNRVARVDVFDTDDSARGEGIVNVSHKRGVWKEVVFLGRYSFA